MNSQTLTSGIEQLRDGFLTRVAERCMAIDAIVEAAPPGRISQADRRQIAHHAHKTAGVAATLGFAPLGSAAASVEELLSGRNAELDWDAVRPAVEDLLDHMERALDSAM